MANQNLTLHQSWVQVASGVDVLDIQSNGDTLIYFGDTAPGTEDDGFQLSPGIFQFKDIATLGGSVWAKSANMFRGTLVGYTGGAGTPSEPSNEFSAVFRTTTSNETVVIPCQNVGTFDAIIQSDGASQPHLSGAPVTSYNDGNLTVTFPSPGDHVVNISGVFPNIYFNNSGDKDKLISIPNLGDVGWTRFNNAFFGCSNLVSISGGETSQVINMSNMLRNCSSLVSAQVSSWDTSLVGAMNGLFSGCTSLVTPPDVSSWDVSGVSSAFFLFQNCSGMVNPPDVSSWDTGSFTSIEKIFQNCSSFSSAPDVSNWVTGSVNNMIGTFENCPALDFPVDGWDISGLDSTNDLNNFMSGSGMPTERYDSLLQSWSAQSVVSSLSPDFGSSMYTAGGLAEASRDTLTDTPNSWNITDGGSVSSSIVTDFALQHFSLNVPVNGGNQPIQGIRSLDNAFIMINNAARTGSGNSAGTSHPAPENGGLGLRLTSTTNVAMDRDGDAAVDNMASFSLWEYVGEAGGPNEFIVRDRRTITLSSASTTYTPTGLGDASRCIPIITGSRADRPASSQWDHALAATAINRTTGEVTVEGRDDQGNLTVEVTLVEFTGSNWSVRYATENTDASDTGVMTLDSAVSSWGNAAIIGQFAKNGGNAGRLADVHPIYKPTSELDEVSWEFHPDHVGTVGQRHTVYVLENAEMDVTRYSNSYASAAPASSEVDISLAGLTDPTDALLIISTTVSGTDSGHMKGQRNVAYVDESTVRHYVSLPGEAVQTEIQVVKLPNIGEPGGGSTGETGGGDTGGSGGESGSIPPVPEYPDSNFTVINLSSGANIQNTINGLGSLAGVKIKLAAGNYASFEVDSAQHGNATEANPFVIEGPATGTARIQDNSSDDTVLIAGSEHVILDRLYIEGAPNSSRAALHVRLKNTGIYPKGFQLLRSTIARREGDGIKFSEVIDTLVHTVVFSDDLNASSSGERHLDFNKFDNMEVYNCDFYGHRAMNVKGGSRNATIKGCRYHNCVNSVEIGEGPGTGYWTLFDGIRNWSVLGTSMSDCMFNDCSGTHIKFKDVHNFTATNNLQTTGGGAATQAVYSYLNGNQLGQSTYQNSNIVVDGVQVVPST